MTLKQINASISALKQVLEEKYISIIKILVEDQTKPPKQKIRILEIKKQTSNLQFFAKGFSKTNLKRVKSEPRIF